MPDDQAQRTGPSRATLMLPQDATAGPGPLQRRPGVTSPRRTRGLRPGATPPPRSTPTDKGSPLPTRRRHGRSPATPRPDRAAPDRPFELPTTRDTPRSSRTAGMARSARSGAWLVVQEPLDLHLDAADPVSLVPMDFGAVDRTILEAHLGVALALPPATGPIGTPQARQLANRRPDGEGLDLRDVADDLMSPTTSKFIVPAFYQGGRRLR